MRKLGATENNSQNWYADMNRVYSKFGLDADSRERRSREMTAKYHEG